MMIIAIIETGNFIDFVQFYESETLADAAKEATLTRVGKVTANEVTPLGGTHLHTISRDLEPEAFWLAQLEHSLKDYEDFGWGQSEAEAEARARGQYEQ